MLDRVLSALSSDNREVFGQICSNLSSQIIKGKWLKTGEHFPLIGKCLYQGIMAETVYLPQYLKAEKNIADMALKERWHAAHTPTAHRKLEILHLYFFKFVNPRWRLRLVRRTGESERIQAEKENTNILTAHTISLESST